MTELHEALVVAHLGKGLAVEVDSQIVLCQTLRKLESIVVGDRVLISLSSPDQGRIEKMLPRRSVLERPSRGGRPRPAAANIDTIFAVFATEPACDFLLLDQYLVICENCNIDAAIIFNKIDLPCPHDITKELEYYQTLGYKLYKASTVKNIGITELRAAMNDQISLFVGQSGVGKSSLTNALSPKIQVRVNSVSATTRHGRHTTTAATLYHLPEGGSLIDSPGVAVFGLAGLSEKQLAWGYREFQPYLNQCRFNDCKHVLDKDCAVRSAVESGSIPDRRYQRFLKLREKMPPANRG